MTFLGQSSRFFFFIISGQADFLRAGWEYVVAGFKGTSRNDVRDAVGGGIWKPQEQNHLLAVTAEDR